MNTSNTKFKIAVYIITLISVLAFITLINISLEPAQIIAHPEYHRFQFINNIGSAYPINLNISSAYPQSVQSLSLPELFNTVRDSVVQINVRFQTFNPHILVHNNPFSFTTLLSGSGFIYDTNGHVITNDHVVIGASTIDVRFLDGNSYSAKVVGADVYSDLAVLQLEGSALYKERLKPIPLGNSSNIQVGEPVVAIGNPLGLTGSMTQGIVSQKGRIMKDANTQEFYVSDMIQTDAPITHGNSGGPLLNLQGQVIGVTERGEPNPVEGGFNFPAINFAIPSNTVKRVVPQLISQGNYNHAWLGAHVIDITSDIAKELGLNSAEGVIVIGVTPGSPAERAGISPGKNATVIDYQQLNSDADIILAIDQKPVREISDLVNYVDSKSPGDKVILKIYRNHGAIHDITLTLAQRPSLQSNSPFGVNMNMANTNSTSYLNQSSFK